MREKLLELERRLTLLQEDFEMLQDGRWSLQYSDGTELEASIDNCISSLDIVDELKSSLCYKSSLPTSS